MFHAQPKSIFLTVIFIAYTHVDNVVLRCVERFGACCVHFLRAQDATAVATLPRKIAISMGAFEVPRAYTSAFTFTKDRSTKSAA